MLYIVRDELSNKILLKTKCKYKALFLAKNMRRNGEMVKLTKKNVNLI